MHHAVSAHHDKGIDAGRERLLHGHCEPAVAAPPQFQHLCPGRAEMVDGLCAHVLAGAE